MNRNLPAAIIQDEPSMTEQPQATAPMQQFENLPLRRAYPFLDENALGSEGALIKLSSEEGVPYSPNNVRRAKVLDLLRRKGLLDKFIESEWPFAASPEGKKKLSYYDKILYAIEAQTEAEADAEAEEFPLEQHLRDYLAKNPGILESGLSLWPVENGNAVEYPVDEQGPSRRIDILAKDQGGMPVVIELKVSRGHERTIGQALYYRARIRKKFNVDKVRIFIVAAKISPEVQAAASEVSDVALFEYSLAVKVAPVSA